MPAPFYQQRQLSRGLKNPSDAERVVAALHSLFSIPKQSGGGGEFEWDPETQGLILGCFYYGYALNQVPGGVLAERYGGKWFMGMYIHAVWFIRNTLQETTSHCCEILHTVT